MNVRSWFLSLIYPLPKEGEDLLMHKKDFIEEYISFHQFWADIKMFFTSQKLWDDVHYQKKMNDQEQKARLAAYKTWRRLVIKDKGKDMKLFNLFNKKRTPLVCDSERAEEDFKKQMQVIRSQDEGMGYSLNDFIQKQVIEYHKPQKNSDILAQKESFLNCYTFQENHRSSEAVLPENLKEDQQTPAYQKVWSKKWHDYDQRARLMAHKKWREMMSNSR